MSELLEACFTIINLPFTLLLMVVVGYWLLLIVGAVGLDALDIDLDFDTDVDPEVGGSSLAGGTVAVAFLRFFNFGVVPAMIVVSFLALSLWTFAILSNHYLNPNANLWIAILLLLPNVAISALVAKLVTTPFRAVFGRLNSQGQKNLELVGKTCVIKSSEATPTFGQAEVVSEGAPFLLNVRTTEGVKLAKGAGALIVHHDPERGIYEVVDFDLEI